MSVRDSKTKIFSKLNNLTGKTKYFLGKSNSGSLISKGKCSNLKKKKCYVLDKNRYNLTGISLGLKKISMYKGFAMLCYNFIKKTFFLLPPAIQCQKFTYIKKGSYINDGVSVYLRVAGPNTRICSINRSKYPNVSVTRSSGCYAVILQNNNLEITVQLSSGSIVSFDLKQKATLGRILGTKKGSTNKGKAGRNSWYGRRPKVRGVAMNPVDHPHGGGEGKTSGGRPSVTPWSKPAHKKKTLYVSKI